MAPKIRKKNTGHYTRDRNFVCHTLSGSLTRSLGSFIIAQEVYEKEGGIFFSPAARGVSVSPLKIIRFCQRKILFCGEKVYSGVRV